MSNEDLKHIIAQLLQDAQRIQQIEPNAGTAARIEEAKAALAAQQAGVNSACLEDAAVTNFEITVRG